MLRNREQTQVLHVLLCAFQIRDRRRSVLLTAGGARITDTDNSTSTMAHRQLRESSSSSSYMVVS